MPRTNHPGPQDPKPEDHTTRAPEELTNEPGPGTGIPEPGPPEENNTPPEPPPRPNVLPNYKPQRHELQSALEAGMGNGDKFTTSLLRARLGLSEAKARVILWTLETRGYITRNGVHRTLNRDPFQLSQSDKGGPIQTTKGGDLSSTIPHQDPLVISESQEQTTPPTTSEHQTTPGPQDNPVTVYPDQIETPPQSIPLVNCPVTHTPGPQNPEIRQLTQHQHRPPHVPPRTENPLEGFSPQYIRDAYMFTTAGGSLSELAQALGTTLSILNRWLAADAVFRQAVNNGWDNFTTGQVEASLRQRALGYDVPQESTEFIDIDGVPHIERRVTKEREGKDGKVSTFTAWELVPGVKRKKSTRHIPPDVAAGVYYTCNRNPERWKNAQRVHIENRPDMAGNDSTQKALVDMSLEDLEQLHAIQARHKLSQGNTEPQDPEPRAISEKQTIQAPT